MTIVSPLRTAPAMGPSLFPQDDLLQRLFRVHDFIYANDGLSAQQALEELVKILFVRLFAEKHLPDRDAQRMPKPAEMADLVRRVTREYPTVFEPDDRLRLSDGSLEFVVHQMWPVSITNTTTDAKGLAFQKFLSHGERDSWGQFFTPQPVVDSCVEIMNPRPEETVIDPACGSGGFLVSALRHMSHTASAPGVGTLIERNLFGCDINSSVARIARMRLLLEDNVEANVHCVNSLGAFDAFADSLPQPMRRAVRGGFDVVLTNPPFGARGIADEPTLRDADLGFRWRHCNGAFEKSSVLAKTQTSEILFVERCLRLAKDGGRLAIVLPNGFFENPSLRYARAYVADRAAILAVVGLPQETFVPYGTGVKTSVLFLRKQKGGHRSRTRVFFAAVENVGYRGNRLATARLMRDSDGEIQKDASGRSLVAEDLSEAVFRYHEFTAGQVMEGPACFSALLEPLGARWDTRHYSPRYRGILQKLAANGAVPLGDVARIVKSKVPKRDLRGVVRYVELSNVNVDYLEITSATDHFVNELPSRASYRLQSGDIVTAVAGNSVGTRRHATALVAEPYADCICSNGFRVLRDFRVDPHFLLFYLRTPWFLEQMHARRTGAAIPCVSDADFAEILVPQPESEEIKRVSVAVKESLRLRERARRALASTTLSL